MAILNPFKHILILVINAMFSQIFIFLFFDVIVLLTIINSSKNLKIGVMYITLQILWFILWTIIYLAHLRRLGKNDKRI